MRPTICGNLLSSSSLVARDVTGTVTTRTEQPVVNGPAIHQLGFEKSDLASGARALIVPPMMTIDPAKGSLRMGDFSAQGIRAGLLMWDAFDFPMNTSINLESVIPDQLVALGVARKTTVESNGQIGMGLAEAYATLFRAYEEQHPNTWSLLSGPDGIDVLGGGRNQTGMINFTSCIPIPSAEVPFEEILHFKERRKDEMLALRQHIEDMILRIQEAGDGELLIDAEVESFRKAAEDHLKAAKDSGLHFKLGDLSGSFNILAPITGGAAAYLQGLSISGALIAGAAAAISFAPSTSVSYKRVGSTPLRYISRAHSELPWA
ncbi:DUF6236 family protein [Paracoccus tibetensis]|uniref:Uncharacterized protein n=1 Tax=Paracoccus tibetensis TaxID=336292 RepID=A0A1G5BD52_9RHOB|nr:DUF6236 family protein [Paracoccus tibetensis]SCX88073.1 hypothetical protein SAMN05660710_00096 [Paracoccus tibetensis]